MSQGSIEHILSQVNQIILGKSRPVKLALSCLLARGHLLIEDLPGVGKTTLAHTLATTLGLSFQRIQFTSDMLPADILGVSVYEHEQQKFTFHRGPIFTQLLLADEVNRASPRTQSALLEAMEEQQVTIEGETFELQSPFFVIATQNPAQQHHQNQRGKTITGAAGHNINPPAAGGGQPVPLALESRQHNYGIATCCIKSLAQSAGSVSFNACSL